VSELIDNRTHRISVLKEIIQHLHAGAAPDLVKARLRKIVGETDATEIMAMEQQLMAEGMPVEEVRSMCDLHSQVTRDALVQVAPPVSIQPGHPVDTFRRENAAIKQVIATMRGISAEIANLEGSADVKEVVPRLRQSANDLMDLDKHYQRKEHALFSCLERHGITGPSKVMWSKDDDVRNMLKQMNQGATFPCADVIVVVPGLSSVANQPAATVATLAFDDRHCTFRLTSFRFSVALNCRLELLSCLGFAGEMARLAEAEHKDVVAIRMNKV